MIRGPSPPKFKTISKETDLATIAVNMQDLKRTVLTIDPGKTLPSPASRLC